MESEAASVEVAVELRAACRASGLVIEGLPAALDRLEEDERAHVAICRAFVEAIGLRTASDAAVREAAPDDRAPSLLVLSYVLTGLSICESVSALRFATVRAHTDLPIPRACLDRFLRDETAHARLGFDLLPLAIMQHSRAVGRERAARDVEDELRATSRHLDLVVGLDAERRGLTLIARDQPSDNPGVVEPMLVALTLYRGMERTIAPRLDRALAPLAVSASRAWIDRWT